MSMSALVICTWMAIAAAAPGVSIQEAWLKGFEGTWVVDGGPAQAGRAPGAVW